MPAEARRSPASNLGLNEPGRRPSAYWFSPLEELGSGGAGVKEELGSEELGSERIQSITVELARAWRQSDVMARPLRVEYEGALHHVMSRGNERQRIVRDDRDRLRRLDWLRRSVGEGACSAIKKRGLPSRSQGGAGGGEQWAQKETAGRGRSRAGSPCKDHHPFVHSRFGCMPAPRIDLKFHRYAEVRPQTTPEAESDSRVVAASRRFSSYTFSEPVPPAGRAGRGGVASVVVG